MEQQWTMLYARTQPTSPKRQPLWLAMVLVGSLITVVTASPQARQNVTFKMLPVSDVKFTRDVLWEKPAKSDMDCIRMCVGEARCSMFTFTPSTDGPGGSCQIHEKRQTLQGEQESAPGARSYSIIITGFWIKKACITSSDCTEPMAACYSGQCLCDGGFFFDYFQNACVSGCTRSLGDTYVQYMDMTLYGHGYYNVPANGDGVTCQPKCTADPLCTGFTYNNERCDYKRFTAQDFPDDWMSWPNKHFNQRTCQ